ncbi:NAD(P)-binding domain-containing protein [Candidatus Solirubrobacter pratensis]|uniref:NAD(P)-binding domain-containing protein n=1 Tax=Candidatus Solirubrobacter pratensis TaxID=1298857 RepID=UPI0003F660B4|nr:NAD(P)-binding domain-containing protein [Candidatus Solirubrobacter pratensis]
MTDVLVIGAGPYGLAAAHAARRLGLSVEVLGRPMSFWREHMPAGMFLRSGPDWHLDVAAELTFEAFDPVSPDPIPIARYLEYADWFAAKAGIAVRDEVVVTVAPAGDAASRGFVATLASGAVISARAVIAAPGIAHFGVIPEWGAGVGAHTVDLVGFDELAGARVVIVGGRQSAYEWAALIGEAGAERVDVVHRHPEPRFDRVSWAFVEPHIERTLAVPGWWRRLPAAGREAIGQQFWDVGRLTLEYWLAPRLARLPVHRHAGVEVVAPPAGGELELSDGTRLHADRIVFACGYRADIARVPYLPPVASTGGFPDLDASFGTSLPGLYIPGFAATRDFGPFFGFVRGAVPAAALIARDLEVRLAT